jgi:hypothetical protein
MILSNNRIRMLSLADHCLYFEINGINYCISPWNMNLECSVLAGGKWLPIRHDSGFQLLHNMNQWRAMSSVFDGFIENIPWDVRTKAVRFRHLQHTILRLMRPTKASIDLADSNPVLLWLIAGKAAAAELPYQDATSLIRSKQKDVLKQLFPNRPALSLGFIKRIQATEYSAQEYRYLNEIMGDDAIIDSLRHCGQVKLEAFAWFRSNTAMIASPLVKRLISGEGEGTHLCEQVQSTTFKALEVASKINHGNPMEALCRCSTFDQLCSLYERWVEEHYRAVAESVTSDFLELYHFELYPPLAPGNDKIKPILSLCGLHIEGEDMAHCAGYTFCDEVRAGDLTVYRVLAPERGTLSISRRGHEFIIEEFALAANKKPSKASWEAACEWVTHLNSRR